MSRRTRIALAAAVAALSLAAVAPAAIAGKPTIQRTPFEDHAVSQSCGFPVQLDAAGTALDISYTDALGNFHTFEAGPQVKQTMTNLITGKTIVVNISGPGQYTFGADGSFTLVGTGLWSWTRVNPATLAPGSFSPRESSSCRSRPRVSGHSRSSEPRPTCALNSRELRPSALPARDDPKARSGGPSSFSVSRVTRSCDGPAGSS